MVETYTIYPCEALLPYVHHYWLMHVMGEVVSGDIMPPASMKWIFHRSSPFALDNRTDHLSAANICMRYGQTVHVHTESELDMICVFFQPYAAKMVLQMPCDGLAGKIDALDNMDDIAFTQLKRMVLEADSNHEALRLIEDFLLKRIYSTDTNLYLKSLQHVSRKITLKPSVRTEQLAEEACLCERQFRTVFKENFGISPKQYLRFNRFMRLHRLIISNPTINLKDLVHEGDFTDYSHLNKDFQHFAGLPPTEFIEMIKQIIRSNDGEAYKSYYT
ncbi:MAG: helix-turn-helix domain-containing protein [Prevotella sp.]